MNPARPRIRERTRGFTLLEVVFAVVLLGMVATSAASLFGLLARLHTDNGKRAAAFELANRIILQHLDDPKSVPSEAKELDYDRWSFRFKVDEEPVRMVVKQTEAAVRSAEHVPMNRFRQVTVRVWATAEGTSDNPGEEMANLTRIYDPLAALLFRNPDATKRILETPEGIQDIMGILTGNAGGTGSGQTNPSPRPAMPPGRQP